MSDLHGIEDDGQYARLIHFQVTTPRRKDISLVEASLSFSVTLFIIRSTSAVDVYIIFFFSLSLYGAQLDRSRISE